MFTLPRRFNSFFLRKKINEKNLSTVLNDRGHDILGQNKSFSFLCWWWGGMSPPHWLSFCLRGVAGHARFVAISNSQWVVNLPVFLCKKKPDYTSHLTGFGIDRFHLHHFNNSFKPTVQTGVCSALNTLSLNAVLPIFSKTTPFNCQRLTTPTFWICLVTNVSYMCLHCVVALDHIMHSSSACYSLQSNFSFIYEYSFGFRGTAFRCATTVTN